MKIAIGTDDKKTIRKGHFGESAYYAVFEVLNGEIASQEIRDNPRTGAKGHHGESGKILDLLHDCELFMARSMGKNSMAKIAEKKVDRRVRSVKRRWTCCFMKLIIRRSAAKRILKWIRWRRKNS